MPGERKSLGLIPLLVVYTNFTLMGYGLGVGVFLILLFIV